MTTNPVEEDLYGGSYQSEPVSSCAPVPHLPRGHWARPDEIYRFWQVTLRPLYNTGCTSVGSNIYFMASVTAKDYETCTVAPHPALKQSHVLVCAEDGDYEFTPRLPLEEPLSLQSPTLWFGLGERPVVANESRVPEEFDPLMPFRITLTNDYFYISQGLNTLIIPRVDKTQVGWENRFRKYLTLSFSGLLFNVKYTESSKVEVRVLDSLK
jgi:hypothetical protein